ncbi:DNA-binding response regulator [Bacillus sp. M6-12]|uniref:response regulator n=1 Tax=Bacillus sp. M6-12 TaxID=2054166 RepID=UPI000C75B744|nr:response regulator transcription factor [Bacillus sp. M6-12]PLS17033.1 DNA-binding response regulator [Bacillus sp. M6-12]
MSIRILIADDHHIVRRGLVFFLNTQEDFEVIGEAQNGREALEMAEKLGPDIILMDLSMPELDGIEATKKIIEINPLAKVMILTSFSDEDHVLPSLEAGASGYQLKESDPDELVRCIRKVVQGENQLHSKATAHLLKQVSGKKNEEEAPYLRLTKRETEVLLEIASGKSNKEIAAALYITEKTVKTHVSNILSKLGLQDRTQAALYAVKQGIGPIA